MRKRRFSLLAAVSLLAALAPAHAQQRASNAPAAIEQIAVEAEALDAHIARVSQSGSGNTITLEQASGAALAVIAQGVGPEGAAGSAVEVTQTGFGAIAAIVQDGAANTLTLNQSGARARATLQQQGNGNTLDLSQTADDVQATVTQLGDANQFVFVQDGAAPPAITVTQTDGGPPVAITYYGP